MYKSPHRNVIICHQSTCIQWWEGCQTFSSRHGALGCHQSGIQTWHSHLPPVSGPLAWFWKKVQQALQALPAPLWCWCPSWLRLVTRRSWEENAIPVSCWVAVDQQLQERRGKTMQNQQLNGGRIAYRLSSVANFSVRVVSLSNSSDTKRRKVTLTWACSPLHEWLQWMSRVSGPYNLFCNFHIGQKLCSYWTRWHGWGWTWESRKKATTNLAQRDSRTCWQSQPRSRHCTWTVHCLPQRLRGSWDEQSHSGRLSGNQWNSRFGSLLCTMSLWEMGIQRCGTPRWQIHLLWQSHFLSPEERKKGPLLCTHSLITSLN